MASVIKIGARWRAQVRRVGVKPITKTFATKAEATAGGRATEAKIDGGDYQADSAITLSRLIDEYQRLRESGGR